MWCKEIVMENCPRQLCAPKCATRCLVVELSRWKRRFRTLIRASGTAPLQTHPAASCDPWGAGLDTAPSRAWSSAASLCHGLATFGLSGRLEIRSERFHVLFGHMIEDPPGITTATWPFRVRAAKAVRRPLAARVLVRRRQLRTRNVVGSGNADMYSSYPYCRRPLSACRH